MFGGGIPFYEFKSDGEEGGSFLSQFVAMEPQSTYVEPRPLTNLPPINLFSDPSDSANNAFDKMENQQIFECFFADIKKEVKLVNAKKAKLIFPTLSENKSDNAQSWSRSFNPKEEEPKIIAQLMACAIYSGDVTAAKYFKKELANQNQKMREHYGNLIKEELNKLYKKNWNDNFSRYFVRFQCRHYDAPLQHPCNTKTLKIFELEEFKEEQQGQYTGNNRGPTVYWMIETKESIIKEIKNILRSKMHTDEVLRFALQEKCNQLGNIGATIMSLFKQGKMIELYAELQQNLHPDEKDSQPTFEEVVRHANPENFKDTMDRLKFKCTEGNLKKTIELIRLAFCLGKDHAVLYFLNQGMKHYVDVDTLDEMVFRGHDKVLDIFLNQAHGSEKYQALLDRIFFRAVLQGNHSNIIVKIVEKIEPNTAIIMLESSKIDWETRYYVTLKLIDKPIEKNKLASFIFKLINTAHDQDRIIKLKELIIKIKKDKGIDIVNIEILYAVIKAPLTHLPNNIVAKLDFLKFLLNEIVNTKQMSESKQETNGVKQESHLAQVLKSKCGDSDSYHGLDLICAAIQSRSDISILDYLKELYEKNKVPIPDQAVDLAFKEHQQDEVRDLLMIACKLPLTLDPNIAIRMLFCFKGAELTFSQLTPVKNKTAEHLFANYSVDPFKECKDPFERFDPFQVREESSTIEFMRRNNQMEILSDLIFMRQLYFDNTASEVNKYTANVCTWLVMSYVNDTPYFSTQNPKRFFNNKEKRRKLLEKRKKELKGNQEFVVEGPVKFVTQVTFTTCSMFQPTPITATNSPDNAKQNSISPVERASRSK